MPIIAAQRPKAGTGTTGQRFELLLHPIPDAIYVITYRYRALQGKLSTGSPYPLGGQQFAEVILESILAMAEVRKNDELGLHSQRYRDLLATAVEQDRRAFAPAYLGYNADRSDRAQWTYEPIRGVKYNGVDL
jgi:hypothetical protein